QRQRAAPCRVHGRRLAMADQRRCELVAARLSVIPPRRNRERGAREAEDECCREHKAKSSAAHRSSLLEAEPAVAGATASARRKLLEDPCPLSRRVTALAVRTRVREADGWGGSAAACSRTTLEIDFATATLEM